MKVLLYTLLSFVHGMKHFGSSSKQSLKYPSFTRTVGGQTYTIQYDQNTGRPDRVDPYFPAALRYPQQACKELYQHFKHELRESQTKFVKNYHWRRGQKPRDGLVYDCEAQLVHGGNLGLGRMARYPEELPWFLSCDEIEDKYQPLVSGAGPFTTGECFPMVTQVAQDEVIDSENFASGYETSDILFAGLSTVCRDGMP